MRALAQLLLSHNKLLSLAGIPTYPPLSLLYVDHNGLRGVNGTLLASLGRASLRMGDNPFHCDCQVLGLSRHARSSSRVLDWPEGYRCQGPAALRGAELSSLRLPQCDASPALLNVLLLFVPVLVSLSLARRCAKRHRAHRQFTVSQSDPSGKNG
ncbi:hypothetical protein AAFF_G00123770 [Aldrovandia affinis]|uniref:LRRCT domain-containing protein n=1 Tax=Aldrovandia affinis TaxID=143900 RepID=A0AAD7W9S1_9TELE|nr:hypothetical protein AAFF_G00123770 [Aldrovandia affinis]